MDSGGELAPKVVSRLLKEVKELHENPANGLEVEMSENNVREIHGEMDGPEGTPFAGGIFKLKLSLPADYPQSAPKGNFLTKIFHPNVCPKTGDICVNTLKKDWDPNHGLRHIFTVIRCLLIEPFPDSALNEEAAKLLLEDYEEYSKRSALHTRTHAMKVQPLSHLGANSNDGADGARGEGEGRHADSPAGKKSRAMKRTLKRL